jgi:hypothetical protein
MNMTTVGKVLLLTNLVLSLFMAGLAFGIYSNHMDWPGVQAGVAGEKPSSEYLELKSDVDESLKAAGIAQARYDEAQETVVHLEKQIPQYLEDYARELAILQGEDANHNPINAPLRLLVFQPRVGRTTSASGLPALAWQNPPRPLKSKRSLFAAIADTEKEIQTQMRAIEELVRKEQDRTIELNGLAAQQKGLRALLDEERKVKNQAALELQHLKPLRYNSEVELEILEKRGQSLSARINELRRLGMASRQP